ncbi:MAG: metallophosphoesterase [Elusimicrobiota bacterium]
MKNSYGFLVFLLFFSLSFVGIHLYCHSFIARKIADWKHLRAFFLFLAFFSVFTMFLRRSFESDFSRFLSLIGFIWMGSVLILAFVFLTSDILILILKKYFVSQKIPIIALVVFTFLFFFSLYKGLAPAFVRKIEISGFSKKPLKIAFFSDMHADFEFREKLFFLSLEKVLSENPDFIVFGGDWLDPGFNISREETEKINNIKIPKIAVLGNHEYYYGLDKSLDIYKKSGFNLLINSSLEFEDVNFIGLSDIKTSGINLEAALKIIKENYKEGKANIILSHQPLYFKEISDFKKVIMLSGHVHRAQIFPFHIFVRLAYKYFYGLYERKGSFLYVTSGAGTWGPPMRLYSESEVPLIYLK